MRSKLKRLKEFGWLAEDGPGLFVFGSPVTLLESVQVDTFLPAGNHTISEDVRLFALPRHGARDAPHPPPGSGQAGSL